METEQFIIDLLPTANCLLPIVFNPAKGTEIINKRER